MVNDSNGDGDTTAVDWVLAIVGERAARPVGFFSRNVSVIARADDVEIVVKGGLHSAQAEGRVV